jgi:nuclear transport factor 2 (NTF2) superfamily protein
LLVLGLAVIACSPQEPARDVEGMAEVEAAAAAAAAAAAWAGGGHDYVSMGPTYTEAWNSRDPARVAEFFAEDGSLTFNDGEPLVGRAAIEAAVKSRMDALPDSVLKIEAFEELGDMRFRYRWTFAGTDTGPGGTGRRVELGGYDEWEVSELGDIATSRSYYDAEDYKRQLGSR